MERTETLAARQLFGRAVASVVVWCDEIATSPIFERKSRSFSTRAVTKGVDGREKSGTTRRDVGKGETSDCGMWKCLEPSDIVGAASFTHANRRNAGSNPSRSRSLLRGCQQFRKPTFSPSVQLGEAVNGNVCFVDLGSRYRPAPPRDLISRREKIGRRRLNFFSAILFSGDPLVIEGARSILVRTDMLERVCIPSGAF